jgi:hypothetical protein
MIFLHLQSGELVLKDDRHLIGILFAQEVGNLQTRKMRLEGEKEVMLTDQPLLLNAPERLAHDAAQRRVGQCLIADEVLGQASPARKG